MGGDKRFTERDGREAVGGIRRGRGSRGRERG